MRERGGLLYAEDVVFEAEIRINIGFILEVSGDDGEALAKVSVPRVAEKS